MKLASLKSPGKLDGELILVTPDFRHAAKAVAIAPTVREAVENWAEVERPLRELDQMLRAGKVKDAFDLKPEMLHAALPRTFLFADGSAFIHHIKLVRKARNAALPETLETLPLMYQAESSRFLDPHESIPQRDVRFGTDMEGEVGVITDFVPMGTSAEDALAKVRLVVLINDVSLRALIPEELAQGFGFFVSKPASALSPCALTLDELGSAWSEGRVHLPLNVKLNNKFFGKANAGEMHFHFGELIAHAAKTRDLAAGTLIGSGTVSNENPEAGSSCLAERRMIEQIESGKVATEFLKPGDRVEIWMENSHGEDLFGRIDQTVKTVD